MSGPADLSDKTPGSCSGNPVNANGDTVVLVHDGESDAVVVLPKAPHECERQAASELVSCIEKISNARLPVVTADSGEAAIARTRILIGRAALPGDGATGNASPITPSDIDKAKGDRPNTVLPRVSSGHGLRRFAWDFVDHLLVLFQPANPAGP